MASLRERIRWLEDASIKVPQEGISIARAALIRDMIQTGRRYEDLTPRKRDLYDNYVPLAKPLFDFTATDLLAKIRRLRDVERPSGVRDDRLDPGQPEDDEEFDEPETFDTR
jgi:hypothetical protein